MWSSLRDAYYASSKAVETTAEPAQALATVERYRRAAAASGLEAEVNEVFGCFVKRTLLQEAPDLTSTITADICDECGVQMVVIANDSMLACRRCAKTRVITSANAWTAAMDIDFATMNTHQKSRLLDWLECA